MGNQNTFTPVLRELDSPIIATKIRFVPWSDYTRTICMRVEVYGCLYAGIIAKAGLVWYCFVLEHDSCHLYTSSELFYFSDRLVSYNIPQGFKGDVDLRDKTYDGVLEENAHQLANGLGQLFDGRVGEDDFTVSPYEWIGWRKTDFSRTNVKHFY